MNRRSIVVSIFALAAVACAAPTSQDDEQTPVADSQEDLSSSARALAGEYFTHAAIADGFGRITLDKSGTYSGEHEPASGCAKAPCFTSEHGTWTAKKSGTQYTLTLNPSSGPNRTYDVVKHKDGLAASIGGATEKLWSLENGACLDDSDCKATEQCAPRMCLMYCAFDDWSCCGPSTCTPKPKPVVCGKATCADGEVCCNPIASICTKPGEACIM
jgi:hypothetical protein